MDLQIERIESNYDSILDMIVNEVRNRQSETSFYVVDINNIKRLHSKWLQLLPRVKPFYAVKCNNLPEIIACLAELGTGFDCASKSEIDQVLKLGVHPSNIVFANPCKSIGNIRYATKNNVNYTTFDNADELQKIAAENPNAKLILRIKGYDDSAITRLNLKFGADTEHCEPLLRLARELNLEVVGVSFHNGSGNTEASSFMQSIRSARRVFDIAEAMGCPMYLLDIGGGFPGFNEHGCSTFEDYARVINQALLEYFPLVDKISGEPTNYVIIAEPGRYYVASSLDFICKIIAKRVDRCKKTGREFYSYYLNGSVYGPFINSLLVNEIVYPELICSNHENGQNENGVGNEDKPVYQTTLWGPTCDSLDCVRKDFMCQEFQVGDWLRFRNMGAYTCCLETSFNGIEKSSVIVVV